MSPIVSVLLPFALELGVPMLTKVLAGKVGDGNAALIDAAIRTVADKAGVTPDSLPEVIKASPAVVEQAMVDAENFMPELIALYTAGLAHQSAVMAMEQGEPWWAWAWRPLAMYGFGVLWFWNIIGLHVLNAWLKIALPPVDGWLLFQLNAVYMGLYMGGHTIKDAVSKVSERMGTK